MCAEYKQLLNDERLERAKLHNFILQLQHGHSTNEVSGEDQVKIMIPQSITSWSRKAASLERADRIKADIQKKENEVAARQRTSDIDKLEKELGISNATE